MPDFFPRRQVELVEWLANFGQRIAESPESLGLTAAQATAFAQVQQGFAQWFAKAQSPVTRTPVCLRVKDEARDAAMQLARELAAQVRARRATTSEQLIALGLRPRHEARRKTPRPRVSPRVRVKKVDGRRLRVRVLERATGRCRKPTDVASAVLRYAVGDEPTSPASPAWRMWKITGRLREQWIVPADVPPGTRVWFAAYWLNDRGEPGPWSEAASAHVDFVERPEAARSLRLAA